MTLGIKISLYLHLMVLQLTIGLHVQGHDKWREKDDEKVKGELSKKCQNYKLHFNAY
jgi:hypothetical protein